MRSTKVLLSLAMVACLGESGAALAYNVIDHDQVQPIYTGASDLELYYQPRLAIADKGCDPYPAVDANGHVSGGLAPDGSSDGDCTRSVGQVYSRYTRYDNKCAIMYAWFMPKDMPPTGIGGHRYEWEGIVVWLDSCQVGARILSINYSEHGKWSVNQTPPTWTGSDGYASFGVHPLVLYHAPDKLLDHHPDPTWSQGGTQPLVGWDYLPAPAQDVINHFDFGAATPPLRDASFLNNLAAAEASTDIHNP
jgi:hypothetical protein